MRFDRLRARGLGPFKEEIDVNFAAITGTLIAITGENGVGKSTLLELLAAGLYRRTPTRGTLGDLATARDAFLEVDFVNGASHSARHTVDATTGKGESVVRDVDGKPLVVSGKVRDFDAWAALHLPAPEVLFASTFAPQGSKGFLGLSASERKSVLLRTLGIERLEALAEKAREHVRTAKGEAAVLDARIADERARSTDPKTIEAAIAALITDRASLEGAVTLAKAKLDEATAAEQIARIARQDIDAHVARRGELVARLQVATAKADDVQRRLTNNQGVLGRAIEIRAAVAKDAEFAAEATVLAATVQAAQRVLTAAENELVVAQDELADLKKRLVEASGREARARGRLADKAVVEAAAQAVPGLRGEVAVLEGDISRTEMEIRERQDLILNSATTRIGGLRTGLEAIATPGSTGVTSIASAALRADDDTAAQTAKAPGLVAEDHERLARTKAELVTKRRALQDAERLSARANEMTNAAAESAEAAAEVVALRTRLDVAETLVPAHTQAAASARAALTKTESDHRAAVAQRDVLAPTVKLAEPLTQAETRVAELEPQAEALRAEAAKLAKDLESLGDLPGDVALPDLDAARKVVDTARAAVAANHSATAVQESKLGAAQEAAKRLQAIEAELVAVAQEVSDWQRLADDLGRDGLQALEIDAAGPELTALVNDLLHTCVGPRWTVSIQASRLSADGKKVLEGCEVSVLDTLKGREGEAETLSGGEGVIVGEAVSLALSMLSCRRSGVQGPTLVRDETGAALDPKNATAYVAMLRRACELVGASRLFFVSHNPDVQALADARIAIADGKISVSS